MTLAFTGVSHWLEPSVPWLRGSKQTPTALCSTPLYEAPWAIAVPVLDHKQRPAAWAELLLAVCSHWRMMWMRQHFPENRFCWWHTKPLLWWLLQSWVHLRANTQNPGVKCYPSQVAAAEWCCEHGIFPLTGLAGVRQLNPKPELVYMGLARCIASRHSWSSPHHLLTLTWSCSLVEVCWAHQNWCGWPERVIPSCPFPQKVRRGKGINPPKSPMAVHIFDVLCLRIGQLYGASWERWDLCPPQKAVGCPLPSIAGTTRSLGFSTFSPCPSKGMLLLTESQQTPCKKPHSAPFIKHHKTTSGDSWDRNDLRLHNLPINLPGHGWWVLS